MAGKPARLLVLLGIYLLVAHVLPVPDGIEPRGWRITGVFFATIAGLMLQPLPGSLAVDPDDGRVNPNGGAIAVGHPLGASGARLALTAVRQLERTAGRYALVALCIGVGQGLAAVLERAG